MIGLPVVEPRTGRPGLGVAILLLLDRGLALRDPKR
jgi:hypothetical protein